MRTSCRALLALLGAGALACGAAQPRTASRQGDEGASGDGDGASAPPASSTSVPPTGARGAGGGGGASSAAITGGADGGTPAPGAPRSDAAAGADTASAVVRSDATVAAPPPISCKDALLCDDFEGSAAGTVPTGWGSRGTVGVDSTHFYSGGKSVHVHTPVGGQKYSFITRANGLFPVKGNAFYGRMMVWLTEAPINIHWYNVGSSGTIPGTGVTADVSYGGLGPLHRTADVAPGYYTSDGADCAPNTSVHLPEKRWFCMEWQFDGPRNELHYWLDGVFEPALTADGNTGHCNNRGTQWKMPVFENLRLGWGHPQSSTIPVDMWIDDVVISSTRAGCPVPGMGK